MKTDYRTVEQAAIDAQARADEIRTKDPRAATDLDIQAAGLNELSASMQAREQHELTAIASGGASLASIGTPAVSEFLGYLRTGAEIQNASLSSTDANGGYVIPEPLHAALIEKVRAADPIFARAAHFDMVGGDATVVLPYKSAHGAVANAAEAGARSEQNSPTFAAASLTAFDYYTDQRATQQWLDSVKGAEELQLGWIVGDIMEQFGADLADGDGNGKAAGVFAATSGDYTLKASGSASAIANTNFLSLYTALHPKYRPNSCWLMSSATLAVAMGFAHPAASSTVPLVDMSAADGIPRILGKPVFECAAPEIAGDAFPVFYGDLAQAYVIGTHHFPVSVLRDPYTATPKVRFYGLARLGGCPWDVQAGVLLQVASTL